MRSKYIFLIKVVKKHEELKNIPREIIVASNVEHAMSLDKPRLYVVVQAGGRGSRLRHHTWNKPKCLVSIDGKPILYHLFEKFPNAEFVIIGDYLVEQIENYLMVNRPKVNYCIIQAVGKGTCSGISEALKVVPAGSPLLVVWGDLIVDRLPDWPGQNCPVLCITSSFVCRWTVTEGGNLQELAGKERGVPGLFYFPNINMFKSDVPEQGEFLRWFKQEFSDFLILDCPDIKELGDFSSIEKSNDREGFCRFFNKIEFCDGRVTKTVVDHAFDHVHDMEVAWYFEAQSLGFSRIPKIYSQNPLIMERVRGVHPHQMLDLSERERRAVLADMVEALSDLHDRADTEFDISDVHNVYIKKTIDRVLSVSKFIPHFYNDSVTINGVKCRNVFLDKHRSFFDNIIRNLLPKKFTPIHGDPTFSNTLINDNLKACFIDPRGYFSKPGIFGDPWYDFSKVYYSAVGGYDTFNRRKFKLYIDNETVEIIMEKSVFDNSARDIFCEYFQNEMPKIGTIHGLIWLALSGYVKDDIDSILAAYYIGLYWLELGVGKL